MLPIARSSMPFFMENLERNLEAIRQDGTLTLPCAPERPLAMVATATSPRSLPACSPILPGADRSSLPVFDRIDSRRNRWRT